MEETLQDHYANRIAQLDGQLREAVTRRMQLRQALKQQTENVCRLEGALALIRELVARQDGHTP